MERNNPLKLNNEYNKSQIHQTLYYPKSDNKMGRQTISNANVSIRHKPNRKGITGITALNRVNHLVSIVHYKSNQLGGLTILPESVCISADSLRTVCFWQASEVTQGN